MKINWKELASTPGYRSLKKALIRDLGGNSRFRSGRSKQELYKLFYWIIGRAQNHAHHLNIPVSKVLNAWEQNRTYWWLNYYDEYNQPKIGTLRNRNVKPMNLETYALKDYREDRWNDKASRFKRLKATRTRHAKILRKDQKGKKPRWSKERKETYDRIRKYRNL